MIGLVGFVLAYLLTNARVQNETTITPTYDKEAEFERRYSTDSQTPVLIRRSDPRFGHIFYRDPNLGGASALV